MAWIEEHQQAMFKSRNCSYVYWSNIDKQLEELVQNCQLAATPRKTTLIFWPISESPWLHLHNDFAGPIKGQYYFMFVNAYSKWPEIFIDESHHLG